MSGTRRAVTVTCIALIVVATAFMPLGGVSLDWLVITPAFTLLPPFTTPVIRRGAVCCDEQSAAFFAILDSRGPPTPSSLA